VIVIEDDGRETLIPQEGVNLNGSLATTGPKPRA
jgi:hypothetical protein